MRSWPHALAAMAVVAAACSNDSSTSAPSSTTTITTIESTSTTAPTSSTSTSTTTTLLPTCSGVPPLTGRVPDGITIDGAGSDTPIGGGADPRTAYRVWSWRDEGGDLVAELQNPGTPAVGDSTPEQLTSVEVAGYAGQIDPNALEYEVPWRLSWYTQPRGSIQDCSWWTLTSPHLTDAELLDFATVVLEDTSSAIAHAEGMVLSESTGVVLLFDDGIDGVLALDLDNRTAARRVVDGQRAGDQPSRIVLTDDSLLVGWGEIYSAPLDGSPSTLVDTATIQIPAAEPGEVWTLTFPGPRIGPEEPALTRVNTDANVSFSLEDFDVPLSQIRIGVPGGLALSTRSGLAIWEAESGTTEILQSGEPIAVASNGRQLGWCHQTCANLRITDLPEEGTPTPQHVTASPALAFSPDGRYLAALAPAETNPDLTFQTAARLVVLDLSTMTPTTVAAGLELTARLQWAPDTNQLFYASASSGRGSLTLGRYQPETDQWERQVVPVGGGSGFVTVDRQSSTSFFPEQAGDPADCRAPSVYPSNRVGTCGFEF